MAQQLSRALSYPRGKKQRVFKVGIYQQKEAANEQIFFCYASRRKAGLVLWQLQCDIMISRFQLLALKLGYVYSASIKASQVRTLRVGAN